MMKVVNVKNLTLLFDTDVEVNDEMVSAFIDLLNGTMSDMFKHSQPQLLKQDNVKIVSFDFNL